MSKVLLNFIFFACFACNFIPGYGQNCSNTNINGAVISLPCSQNCTNLNFRIPHLKSTEDYTVSSIPYLPYPYVTSAPSLTLNCNNLDDKFFDTTFLPFTFCFYNRNYTKMVVSTNGVVTFDSTNALKTNSYGLTAANQLPYAGTGTQLNVYPGPNCSAGSSTALFPRACIMGAYYDINIDYSSANKKMEVSVVGSAPCRKIIISYFEIPLFSCTTLKATQQIVLHEGSALVEVFIGNKPPCSGWQGGRAILGIQNWDRNKAVAAPGKNCTAWSATNEGYRFTPSGSTSRFVRSQIFSLDGTYIADADTSTSIPGMLNLRFNNICPPAATSTKFLIRTTFFSCEPGAETDLTSEDTVTINRVLGSPLTFTSTQAPCGIGATGSITITAPVGPSYKYSIDGTTFQLSPVFNVVPGTYTITAKDTLNGCVSTQQVVIGSNSGITATATSTPATCPGSPTGTVTITASNGTASYQYSLDGGPLQSSNVFTGVLNGNHNVQVWDAAGCSVSVSFMVMAGTGITATATSTNAACSGSSTGSIMVTPAGGQSPYQFSLNGGLPQLSSLFPNLSGNTYNIQVTDLNGCTTTVTSVVANNPGITATATSTNAACTGSLTGSITVTPSGGQSPYNYILNNGLPQTSNQFPGLGVGSYDIKVTDANGCDFTFSQTVAANPGVTATAVSTNAACAGSPSGSITVTPSGGQSPYHYSLNGGLTQLSNVFPNITASTYAVQVTDAIGCSFNFNQVVGSNNGISASAVIVPASCSTASNGSITVVPANGQSPYQYSLNGGAPQAGNFYGSLTPGTYNFTVTDQNGCSYAFSPVVGSGAGITATATSTNAACSGSATGSITVTPASGQSPFTFSLNGGLVQTSNVFPGLTASTYTIDVTDASNCRYSFTKDVVNDPGVTATVSSFNSACAGGLPTGKLIVKPILGTAPFQYSIDMGAHYQLSDTFSNLAAKTYSILIRDANNCTLTLQAVVANGSGVTGSVVTVNSACSGGLPTGKIIVKASQGTAPFSYSIDGGQQYQLLDTFYFLPANTYPVRIRDANECVYDLTAVVGNDPGITASAQSFNSACSGGLPTGKIVVNALAGTPPYQYSIDNGPLQLSNVFTQLPSGPHSLLVIDKNNCQYRFSKTVNDDPGVAFTTKVLNSSCANVPNGNITVNVVAGIPPFSYSIDGRLPQASNFFGDLLTGTYNITVTDSANCSSTAQVNVGYSPKLTASIMIVRPNCFGLASGEITVNANLGIPPYSFALDNGPFQPENIFKGVSAGGHIIYVKDNNNCLIDTSFTITQPAALSLSVTQTTAASCSGYPDGSISVAATGGSVPYEYSLNDATALPVYQQSPAFNVIAGNYLVTVKDANGCKASVPGTITLVDTMYLDLGKDSVICEGQSVQFKPVTNIATGNFNWTPGYSLNDSTIRQPIATPTDTTLYILQANWGICSRRDSITVFVLHKPDVKAGDDTVICNAGTALLHGVGFGGSGPVSYSWTPSVGLSDPFAPFTPANPPGTLTYTLSVRDEYGCNFTASDQVHITMMPPVPAFAGNDTIAVAGIPHQMLASGGVNYIWQPSALMDNPFVSNPRAVINQDTRFSVTVTDAMGCVGHDAVFIKVYAGPTYYVPNAFSPGHDGLNDVFRPIPVGIVSTDFFRVFNRFGQLIFETSKWMAGWDGKFKGQDQDPGTYVWVIRGKDRNGRIVEKKGTVVLVR